MDYFHYDFGSLSFGYRDIKSKTLEFKAYFSTKFMCVRGNLINFEIK